MRFNSHFTPGGRVKINFLNFPILPYRGGSCNGVLNVPRNISPPHSPLSSPLFSAPHLIRFQRNHSAHIEECKCSSTLKRSFLRRMAQRTRRRRALTFDEHRRAPEKAKRESRVSVALGKHWDKPIQSLRLVFDYRPNVHTRPSNQRWASLYITTYMLISTSTILRRL